MEHQRVKKMEFEVMPHYSNIKPSCSVITDDLSEELPTADEK